MNAGKICISVCSATADGLIEQIRLAESSADIVEVRFDCLSEAECTPEAIERVFLAKSQKPWIATFRATEQGGRQPLTFEQRAEFWNRLPGVEYADLEEDVISKIAKSRTASICSFHDLSGVPSNVEAIYERLSATGADIIKIAYAAEDVTDTIPIWRLLERAKRENRSVIPIAMGDAGKITRILGPARGAFLTFATLAEGGETAPGQISARDLQDVYRVREHRQDTAVFGVIGDPISQSLSPFMHNPAFAAAGIDAVFVPLLVRDIGEFMRRLVRSESREVDLNFGGFSVTMPHKQSIIPFLDELDPTAAAIGAVNTVSIQGSKLIGFNTDADGFIAPLRAKYGDLNGVRVAVFGAGGAARAVVFALRKHGAVVTVFARDVAKAEKLAAEFGISASAMSQTPKLGTSFDILVDTTPLGMKGSLANETLFTADELDGLKMVFDLVTSPVDTPIIREAKLAGISAIGGLEMLVAQGVRQFEIWTGADAPLNIMRQAVAARLNALRSN